MDSDVKIDGDGCNLFEENKTFDKLIVMDDLSNVADKSDDFANFLMVSQKFGYIFFYLPYYLSNKINMADDFISG